MQICGGTERLLKLNRSDTGPVWHRRSHHATAGLAALGATVGKGEGAGGCGHTGVQVRGWSSAVF